MEHVSQQDPLIFGEDFLFDLVKNYSLSNLKDAKTKKYIQMNYRWAEALGLDSTDDLIGLTTKDLHLIRTEQSKGWHFSNSFMNLHDDHQREIEKFDDQVRISKQSTCFKEILFDSNGFLVLEETKKIPIIYYRTGKVVAIFTHGQNITLQLGLFDLLGLYKKYYPEKRAIQQLLRYLRLDQFFTEPPTLTEMRLLFTMRHDPRHKCAAKSLDLAVGTVEIYAHKLREKLAADLNNVLAGLRAIPHV